MPIENAPNGIFASLNIIFFLKAFFVLFLVFYSFFAVILFRQIQIMNKKLPTRLSGLLRFVGIVHIGLALALLFIVIGVF